MLIWYSDYYPYGMLQPGRNAQSENYRYGFQGQERDDEVKGAGNSINYTFRMHDPRLGRMLSIDPMEMSLSFLSAYCFAANNPISFIDEQGVMFQFLSTHDNSMSEEESLFWLYYDNATDEIRAELDELMCDSDVIYKINLKSSAEMYGDAGSVSYNTDESPDQRHVFDVWIEDVNSTGKEFAILAEDLVHCSQFENTLTGIGIRANGSSGIMALDLREEWQSQKRFLTAVKLYNEKINSNEVIPMHEAQEELMAMYDKYQGDIPDIKLTFWFNFWVKSILRKSKIVKG